MCLTACMMISAQIQLTKSAALFALKRRVLQLKLWMYKNNVVVQTVAFLHWHLAHPYVLENYHQKNSTVKKI